MTKDAHDFLMSTGVPAAKFPQIGASVTGEIISYEKAQQRDMQGNPKNWDDGSPMWQIIFTLQTEEIDPTIDADDGMRKVNAKAQMLNAIRQAVKKSGHRGDLVGGKLQVKYVDDGEAQKGFQPPKLYAARFKPAEQTADLGEEEPVAGTDDAGLPPAQDLDEPF